MSNCCCYCLSAKRVQFDCLLLQFHAFCFCSCYSFSLLLIIYLFSLRCSRCIFITSIVKINFQYGISLQYKMMRQYEQKQMQQTATAGKAGKGGAKRLQLLAAVATRQRHFYCAAIILLAAKVPANKPNSQPTSRALRDQPPLGFGAGFKFQSRLKNLQSDGLPDFIANRVQCKIKEIEIILLAAQAAVLQWGCWRLNPCRNRCRICRCKNMLWQSA